MTRGGWDHTKNGLWVKSITTIRAMRGIQWGKDQIMVLEGGWVHEIYFLLNNDRYDWNKGEERNPMG
jgi:hypothetical protein